MSQIQVGNLASDLRKRHLEVCLQIDPAVPDPGASAHMFQFYAEDHDRFTGDRDLEKTRALNPALESFATWLTKHRDALKASQN